MPTVYQQKKAIAPETNDKVTESVVADDNNATNQIEKEQVEAAVVNPTKEVIVGDNAAVAAKSTTEA